MELSVKIIVGILMVFFIFVGAYLVKGNMTKEELLGLIGRAPQEIIFLDGEDYGQLECWYYEPLFMCFAKGKIVFKSYGKL